ncbi:MAG: hypothetical protein ABSB35_33740 [Bryobacteraceae bacterium]
MLWLVFCVVFLWGAVNAFGPSLLHPKSASDLLLLLPFAGPFLGAPLWLGWKGLEFDRGTEEIVVGGGELVWIRKTFWLPKRLE